ncbi:MAG: UDP-N-acetylmuramate dehydrogenase [Candidatus Edwardsbacteria bacterium]
MKRKVYQEIAKVVQGRCYFNELMSCHTSFRIGGPADLLIYPSNLFDLKIILKIVHRERIPLLVIGKGTNLLVSDTGFRGIVIKTTKGFNFIERKDDSICAGSGVTLSQLINFTIANSLTGMEFATGIPGTVGGAVIMNAGAYGGEIGNVVKEIKGVYFSGKEQILKQKEIGFAYRQTKLPLDFLVTEATLQLKEGKQAVIKRTVTELLMKRKKNQPLSLPSAGCIFKNPPQDSARRLIAVAGGRGLRCGAARVSKKHPNFIINRGGAKATEVLKLIEQVKKLVYQEFNVELMLEVKIVGEDI